jgi:hypothetical protein
MNARRRRKEESQKTNKICYTCKAMTSTLQGLQALASQEGYEHLTREMISDSAKRGCSMCAVLDLYDDGYAAYDRHVRVFAELENSNSRVETSKSEHPFHNRRIKCLFINSLPVGVWRGNELCAFTTIG